MADIQTVTWSETASSNNASPADGWPEGQSYASVNNCAREMMGALKREWNRSHPTISTAGTSTALTLTYATAPTLVQGIQFSFRLNQDIGAAATLNVNGLGATTLYKQNAGGTATVLAKDYRSGQIITVQYDTTLGGFAIVGPDPKAAYRHVSTTSIAAGTSVTISLPSEFTNYRIIGTRIVGKTNGSYLNYQHSANGTSYSASANDYSYSVIYAPNASGAVSAVVSTTASAAAVIVDTAASTACYFDMLYSTTAARHHGTMTSNRYNSGSPYFGAQTGSSTANGATGTITNLKFLFNASNSFSGVGSITVIGISEAT